MADDAPARIEADAGLPDGADASGPISILTPSAMSTSAAPEATTAAVAVLCHRHPGAAR
jgi:hypothetical protein